MERRQLQRRTDRAADFTIRHRRWVIPLSWLAMVAVAVLGASIWGGFEPEALPWIAGVLAVIAAGVSGGSIAVWKGRREGWTGILGWLVLPVVLVGSLPVVDQEGWAPTFFTAVFGILLALTLAATAIACATFDARPGSRWDRVTRKPEANGSGPIAANDAGTR